jgi:hypothetical protein
MRLLECELNQNTSVKTFNFGEGTVTRAAPFDSPRLSVDWEQGLSKTPQAARDCPPKTELDVAGLVDAVDVTDILVLLIGVEDIFGAGIELGFVDVFVIDAVFFATGDAELNFEGHFEAAHFAELFFAAVDVLLQRRR